jgi:phytoene/squalene synthetase
MYAWLGSEQYALYTTVRKLANMSDATAAAAMKAVNNTVLFRKALLDGGYNSKHELNAALAEAQAAKKGSASATASAATALTVVTGISTGVLN